MYIDGIKFPSAFFILNYCPKKIVKTPPDEDDAVVLVKFLQNTSYGRETFTTTDILVLLKL